MENRAQGVAMKTISVSEIDPTRSNKHSFHGVIPFRKLLGERRITFHAKFVYAADDHEVISESFVTWYDDCEGNPNPKCENHWRLYYPDTLAIAYARAGDRLLVARLENEDLLLVMTPQGSNIEAQLREKYAADPRLETVTPPQSDDFPQVGLPQSFTQAKKLLVKDIYARDEDRQTFYCGCNYSKSGKIDPVSCGYKPRRKGSKRAQRLEWEHIVPASYIGNGRACWSEGHQDCMTRNGNAFKGRRCCEKVDEQFRGIMADPNNLVPEIGELNADRSNYPHREIEGEERAYGACDFEVDFKARKAEPAIPLRGFIGRTWLYMHKVHGVRITEEDKRVYTAWAQAFPAQKWEIGRQNRIWQTLESKQGR